MVHYLENRLTKTTKFYELNENFTRETEKIIDQYSKDTLTKVDICIRLCVMFEGAL